MNMRLPWPRRRAAAVFPPPAPVPLHTPGTEVPPGAIPLEVALHIARRALTRHQDANIHSRTAMFHAAVDLEHALRTLVTALDHPQDT
ncbi:hypothetical protein ACFVZH_22510 [Streptomyces sp. NPDC059534]|uniref:hypothetical protein n=1 Tax=Streptomyces sp. NPDC059534 TaxID=3346859 RepID=UPI0036AC4141